MFNQQEFKPRTTQTHNSLLKINLFITVYKTTKKMIRIKNYESGIKKIILILLADARSSKILLFLV